MYAECPPEKNPNMLPENNEFWTYDPWLWMKQKDKKIRLIYIDSMTILHNKIWENIHGDSFNWLIN